MIITFFMSERFGIACYSFPYVVPCLLCIYLNCEIKIRSVGQVWALKDLVKKKALQQAMLNGLKSGQSPVLMFYINRHSGIRAIEIVQVNTKK
jgi:hypothetical protein